MKKILIIGNDSYLATGLDFVSTEFSVDKIFRPFSENFERYNDYDFIINFCIQPEHFSRLLSNEEMIDVHIAKQITNHNTKYIFLSSRKVYGTNTELKEYNENDELNPFDFYSKNKVNIEKNLTEILDENQLLILRTSNIVDIPPKHHSPTFISWLESELKQHKKVVVTVDKKAKKDFITRDYFQYAVSKVIENNICGICNIGANFSISIEELMSNLISQEKLLFEQKEENGEQFVLNCEKLHTFANKFTKEQLLDKCKQVKDYMEKQID